MADDTFPYGNDLKKPEAWAGLGTTKSKTWYIGYDSGWSFIVGGHTFLMYGLENLVTAVVTFKGIGASAGFGLGGRTRKLDRAGGRSPRPPQKLESGEPFRDLGNAYEAYDKAHELKSATDWLKSGDDLSSAFDIYNALMAGGRPVEADVPFSLSDLEGEDGVVAGTDVDVGLGAASAYFISADPYFKDQPVYNISSDKTVVSASLGALYGYWEIKKMYNFFREVVDTSQSEYPFTDYVVNEFFHDWRSTDYDFDKKFERYQKRNEILKKIKDDMTAHPEKYAYADDSAALQRIQELNQEYDQFLAGKIPPENLTYLKWVPWGEKYLFF